jgi:general secretion pathway protein D
MRGSAKRLRLFILIGVAWALVGCAQQRIRDEADQQLREGRYEAAIQTLKQGVDQYPDSALLRVGLASAESDGVGLLLSEAMAQRSAGNLEGAQERLNRAAALSPQNPRVRDLQAELARDTEALKALGQAKELHKGGKLAAALQAVDAGLARAPRHVELNEFKRQLESDLRLNSALARQHQLAETRTVSLGFNNAPLSSLMEALRDGTGINFVLDRDVQTDQRASVFIKDARAEDAIDLMLSAFQLSRRIVDSKTVLVYPNTPEKHKLHREQVIRVFHLAHVQAKTAADMLQNLLRIEAPYVDERANMLALREPPEIVALAERLVALHDIGDAEVMLEVEVLEVKTSRLTELGINFPNNFSFSLLPSAGQNGITVDTFNNLNLRGGLNGINYNQVGLSVGSLLVNLKREVGDFNTLANPRIRARNREKATILVGDKVPVITTTAASSGGFISESVNYLDVGLKLEVESVVSPSDEVAIKLGLEVSSLAREVRSPTGTVAYQIGTRNANTTLRLRDGETQLLGGLISNEDRTTSNRVPGLGDLPIAGRLFSSQKDDVQRTELILAITPRILRGAARPDIAQAEMWVGTESFTRLRPPPRSDTVARADTSGALASQPSTATSATSPKESSNTTAAAPKGLVLSLQGPAQMKVGEEAEVVLKVQSDVPLTALPLVMGFTADKLQVLAVNEGNYFRQSNAVSTFGHAVQAQKGRLNAGLMSSTDRGVQGEGTVFTARVKAIAAGQASLKHEGGDILGVGTVVPLSTKPAWTVEVQ